MLMEVHVILWVGTPRRICEVHTLFPLWQYVCCSSVARSFMYSQYRGWRYTLPDCSVWCDASTCIKPRTKEEQHQTKSFIAIVNGSLISLQYITSGGKCTPCVLHKSISIPQFKNSLVQVKSLCSKPAAYPSVTARYTTVAVFIPSTKTGQCLSTTSFHQACPSKPNDVIMTL